MKNAIDYPLFFQLEDIEVIKEIDEMKIIHKRTLERRSKIYGEGMAGRAANDKSFKC